MFSARLDKTMDHIWNHIQYRSRMEHPIRPPYQGIVFSLHLELAGWHDVKKEFITRSATAHVLLYGRTTMFTAIYHGHVHRTYKSPLDVPLADWSHYTSHDDCWRMMQPLNDAYFQMAEAINSQLVEPIAPASMTDWSALGGQWMIPWHLVVVTDERDKNDPASYRRKIIDLKKADSL